MEDKLDRIKSIVCDIAGITEKQFVGHCRRPNITNARHIFIGILEELGLITGERGSGEYSLQSIGVYMGNKHHSSVLHSRTKHHDYKQTDKNYYILYNKIKNKIVGKPTGNEIIDKINIYPQSDGFNIELHLIEGCTINFKTKYFPSELDIYKQIQQ